MSNPSTLAPNVFAHRMEGKAFPLPRSRIVFFVFNWASLPAESSVVAEIGLSMSEYSKISVKDNPVLMTLLQFVYRVFGASFHLNFGFMFISEIRLCLNQQNPNLLCLLKSLLSFLRFTVEIFNPLKNDRSAAFLRFSCDFSAKLRPPVAQNMLIGQNFNQTTLCFVKICDSS